MHTLARFYAPLVRQAHLAHRFLIILFLALTVGQNRARAQSNEQDLADLLARLVVVVGSMNANGYNVVHIEVDKLKEGQSASLTRTLFERNRYAIYGVGTQQVRNLDLCVYSGETGERLLCDQLPDNLPIVTFDPAYDRPYSVQASLVSLTPGASSAKEYFYLWVLGFKRHP